MRIVCFSTFDELTPYAEDWDRLAADMPFRSWTWLSKWWRHYGPQPDSRSPRARLAVLCAFDDANMLVGIAPWYLDRSTLYGRTLRALGSGEACSDYLGVLCHPSLAGAVVEALADYLVEQAQRRQRDALRWDLLELTGVDAQDREVAALAATLSRAGCGVHQRSTASCWRLKLPTTWDAYVASLGKNLRRDLRRWERNVLNSGCATLHVVERLDELPRAMDILLDLHQRRRRALGEAGCFASQRFTAFYREVVPALFRCGQVEFFWLELDGKPVAAEYQLVGNSVLYFYQAGIDPDALQHRPGKLIFLSILRRAIARGYCEFDFLRGDEPYKAHFGAAARPAIELRMVPRHAAARLRHGLWRAGDSMKHWIKRRLKTPITTAKS